MADVFEDEMEQTVSLNEFLEEVEDQELEADLVLGGDEGKECTYDKGYMKRQAIFSCITCTPDGNAGICTACSLSCHDGHEIIELWTKRNFRCDCGNSKFRAAFCKLFPGKDIENVENLYNHNFGGQYCACGSSYPDLDAQEQVEMIQCCICEDWFHEEHLGVESPNEVPRDEDGEPLYEELICHKCSKICSFLHLYPQTLWASHNQHNNGNTSKEKGVKIAPLAFGSSSNLENGTSPEFHNNVLLEKPETCRLGDPLLRFASSLEKSQPMFLLKNWREALCRCAKCLHFYAKNRIGFLVDKEDSIVEYEKMAKQKREEKLRQLEGAELSFLGQLRHVEKIEILSGIANMKDEIRSFLQSFDASKSITTDDIHQVFDNLKRRRHMS